ncbi:mechanosensitive ion channel family protein [Shewanella sp. JM162201]|uniref:Mechanosensitive ion channel family protein n=1 Tax=Shewanella jiangmenensis TaxID=2837387 RepID=A0ABS5V0H3_9GAMM|nr:mechanosensitive ion channel family protein [Shewanella jiangmenensis]MBT1443977.1 mechanosensitive ion channel family protein [Shewanella jiangmenensis]
MTSSLPVFIWIAEHFAWLGLTLVLMSIHAIKNRKSRRELLASVGLTFGVLILALMVQYEGGWLKLPLPQHWLAELVTLLMGLVLIRIWGQLLFGLLLPTLKFRVPQIVADIVVAVAYVCWGLYRLYATGLSLGEIVTTSAVITAIIAFSMQDTLGNLLAGISIQLDNSIGIDDWLMVDTVQGRVVQINWRATTIETRNWETVVIPNSLLLKQRFTVLGRRQGQNQQWRRWIWFDLTLDTLPTQIIALVEQALRETQLPNVATYPKPDCLLMSVEKGIAHYAVRYWLTDLACDDPTDSVVRTLIDAALRRNDRRLTPPVVSVLMTQEQQQQQARHKRHTAERISTLKKLSLFAMLQEDELMTLADSLRFAPFVNGDQILRQGEVTKWLFIIIKGEAELVFEKNGRPLTLGVLKQGDFCGELSLLTGEPSSFSVIAKGTVESYRINQEMFQSLFMAREEMLQPLHQALNARQQELVDLLAREANHQPPKQNKDLLNLMMKLFGRE